MLQTILKTNLLTNPLSLFIRNNSTHNFNRGLPGKCPWCFHKTSRNASTKTHRLPFEVDTNVSKDVILYSYNNARFHRMLNIFGTAQFIFWTYLSHFAYTCLRDTSHSTPTNPNEKKPFWKKINFGENKYRNGITLLCFSLGYIVLVGTWMFSFRSIRGLVLLRGGERVKFVTYGPFARERVLEFPVTNMTCHHSRHSPNSYLAIKVKGYWMHFLLDKQGTFSNTKLFDMTAGVKRVWK